MFPIIHCSSAQPHRYSLLGWASGLNGRLRPCLARRYPLISSAGSPDTTPSLHSPPSPALFPSLASPSSSAELLSCTLNGPQRPELKARAHPNDALPCPCPTVPQPHILPFSLLHTRCDAWLTRALQVPSIRHTCALFDRETLLPPLLHPRVLGILSPVSVPHDFTFTSGS